MACPLGEQYSLWQRACYVASMVSRMYTFWNKNRKFSMKSPIRLGWVYFSNSKFGMRIQIRPASRPENERAKILSELNFRPAVNRQPMFPREMTRRADSACLPMDSYSAFSRLLQRTRPKNNQKHPWNPLHTPTNQEM